VAGVKVLLLGLLLLAIGTLDASPGTQLDDLIARAKALELDTPYVPPPGDPLVHHAAGYAKVMCSAVFMTFLSPDFAAENVGFFTAPYEIRAKLGKPVVDRANKTVFWVNGVGQYPVPREAYYMAGARGQTTMIIPSHDLVVVRLGHYKGEVAGAFWNALTLLVTAVISRMPLIRPIGRSWP
jgi:hypothetical protein